MLKSKIYNIVHKLVSGVQAKIEAKIPKTDLEEKHISNLKVLSNRTALLENLPKTGIIAELGVNKGEFSQEIWKISCPQKLHLVDAWGSERYHVGLKKGVEASFDKEIKSGKVTIHQGYSTDVAEEFPDEYFDWVYIDTEHSYHVTKSELQAYKNKIKPGGIIAGHDYSQGNWGKILKYGVMESVHEFCVKENWEIVYLTIEMSINPSFAIKKIR